MNDKPDGSSMELAAMRQTIVTAASDTELAACRRELARSTSEVFDVVGGLMYVGGWIVGPDRTAGKSPFGNGSDETVAISVLLRIGGQLVRGSLDLLEKGNTYAAAALLRQLVEVEYLSWAFETRNGDGERWMRSNHKDRQNIFSPVNLRRGSNGKFRDKDYRFHCEHGGHPVPNASVILDSNESLADLLIADMLGHSGRIWDHMARWARHANHGGPILERNSEMLRKYGAWKACDPLARLPPPP